MPLFFARNSTPINWFNLDGEGNTRGITGGENVHEKVRVCIC